jgi:hypothetical protein
MKKGTLMRATIFVLGLLACILLISCDKKVGGGAPVGPEFGVKPNIVYFTANPSTIKLGVKSTLSWEVTDATKVEIDVGIGLVSGTGSIEVSPSETTTYTLTATNAQFDDTSQTTGYATANKATKTCTVTVEN